jgi:hypothetical protein
MANTAEEGVRRGLDMLGVASGRLAITWEQHEKQKLMRVELASGRIFKLYASINPQERLTLKQNATADEVLARLRTMMRTSRFKPAVLYFNTDKVDIPLFVPRSNLINMKDGTQFIGADMLVLNQPPSNIEIWRHYVFTPMEIADGKAPRAYHMNGLREWFRTGHTTHPFMGVPLRRENISRTNAWQTYR